MAPRMVYPADVFSPTVLLPISCAFFWGCIGRGDSADAKVEPPCEGPAAVGADGVQVGDTLPDALLIDQDGESLCLSDFSSAPLALEIVPIWTHGCEALTGSVDAITDSFDGTGLIFAVLITESMNGDSPTVQDLRDFADYYELQAPVLADPEDALPGAILGEGESVEFLVMGPSLVVGAEETCPSVETICSEISSVVGADPPILCSD